MSTKEERAAKADAFIHAAERWADRHKVTLFVSAALLLTALLSIQPAYGGPIDNLTPAGNLTNFTAAHIQWNPETGFYTRWWFNTSRDLPDPFGFFYSLFLPIATMTGWSWMFFIMWGAIVTAYYLSTEETTMPFVIGIFSGAVFSITMGSEQLIVMILVMIFLGGGVLSKVLLGRQ